MYNSYRIKYKTESIKKNPQDEDSFFYRFLFNMQINVYTKP